MNAVPLSSHSSVVPTAIVGVDPTLGDALDGLVNALRRCSGVELATPATTPAGQACGAWVVATLAPHALPEHTPGWHTLIVQPVAAPGEAGAPVPTGVVFADDDAVPWPFRGRSLEAGLVIDGPAQSALAQEGGAVLARTGDGQPLWSLRRVEGRSIHRSALRMPRVTGTDDPGLALQGVAFVQGLPLFQALRAAAAGLAFAPPPLRAGFIVDDPNLHWPTYGYADYRQIALSARRDGYHVAFATIPLDTWWVQERAARIFREHADGLSLLVHGNNHSRDELARAYTPAERVTLLQQALARIGRLESRSGVAVSRVMVPPHGACSADILALLPRLGFDGACISAGSLRAHNSGRRSVHGLGLAPTELVDGCPVMPRWTFDAADDARLLVAAYLGQPLILRCHHQDLKDGVDLFRAAARRINALGEVRWADLSTLNRLNLRQLRQGATLWIEPYGLDHVVAVPEGVTTLRVADGARRWNLAAADDSGTTWPVQPGRPLAVQGGHAYRLHAESAAAPAVTPRAARRATPPALIVRRLLTEMRDRLKVA